ncbi:MAG: sulfurtransferase TusA family protein [Desulfococcaceae bacterium]
MKKRPELRLTGMMYPFSLLVCQKTLYGLAAGDEIDVLISEPAAVADLTRIIERSPNQILENRPEGDCFRVRIRKGGTSLNP